MRFPIDVVFLDADQIVIKIVPNLSPSRPPRAEARGRSWSFAPASASDAASRSATGSPGRPGLGRHGRRRPLWTSRARGAARSSLASRDQRYLKLVRFLLDGKGIDVVASVPPQGAADAAGGESADVVVIDAGAVTEGLRLASITAHAASEATVVLVGEQAADRAPAGMQIYEKWDDTDGVVAAVEDAIERKAV